MSMCKHYHKLPKVGRLLHMNYLCSVAISTLCLIAGTVHATKAGCQTKHLVPPPEGPAPADAKYTEGSTVEGYQFGTTWRPVRIIKAYSVLDGVPAYDVCWLNPSGTDGATQRGIGEGRLRASSTASAKPATAQPAQQSMSGDSGPKYNQGDVVEAPYRSKSGVWWYCVKIIQPPKYEQDSRTWHYYIQWLVEGGKEWFDEDQLRERTKYKIGDKVRVYRKLKWCKKHYWYTGEICAEIDNRYDVGFENIPRSIEEKANRLANMHEK